MCLAIDRRPSEVSPPAARRTRLITHLPAALAFAVLAVVWTYPLALRITTHVPGAVPFDNMTFVWNLWWMRTAWQALADPFYTPYLFHPVGVDLALHTHTTLSGFVAATVLGRLTPVAAQNVLLVVWVFLNGFTAYRLAYRLCGHRAAAVAAGIAFGSCPAVLVRLSGHFNLVAAWVLPLSMLAALRQSRRGPTGPTCYWASRGLLLLTPTTTSWSTCSA